VRGFPSSGADEKEQQQNLQEGLNARIGEPQ
jgi:hypothetical protein